MVLWFGRMTSMTPEQAAQRLAFHAQPDAGSFLNMLRPFEGIDEAVLQDVMAALDSCAPALCRESIARDLLSAIWAISRLGRLWALEPGGTLRRNALISDADVARLDAFIESFDLKVLELIAGRSQPLATPNA